MTVTLDNRGSPDGAARDIVLDALEALHALLPPGTVIAPEFDSPLARPEGPLDSLGLVNLLVGVEDGAMGRFGRDTGLMGALALPLEEGPFRTVGTLIEWVAARSAPTHE